MSIHQRIKQMRLAAGLSQNGLASAVSALQPDEPPITRQTIQHWEREEGTAPKRTRLEAVATVLGTTAATLLYGSNTLPTGSMVAAEPDPKPWVFLPQAVEQVVSAICGLSPSSWAMVRAALDSVVLHPELRDDVAASVLVMLQASSGKRLAAV